MRRSLIVGLLCWPSLSAAAAPPAFKFFEPLMPPRRFQVMVHRGLARQAPENTRAAIQMCIDDGLEWVEVDVRTSKDGQEVLFHDSKLDGKTNATGPLADYTLDELAALDGGSWFARRFAGAKLLPLYECLLLAKGKINLYLDCKQVAPERLVRHITCAGMQDQVVVFADRDTLNRVRELSEGKIAVMPKWRSADGMAPWLDQLRPAIVEIDADQVSHEICRSMHERGILVQAKVLGQWDNAKVWDRMLDAGVDHLQTDLPEEIVAHALAKKLRPRPARLACHRGASRHAPENTLPAFEKASRLHADFVEFDVRPSSDARFFLMHDASVNRTTDGQGPIRSMTSSAVEALDAGGWFGRPFAGTRVPSLEQFLAAVGPDLQLYFDAKDIPPEALAAALAKHNLAERTVVYKGADYLRKLKELDPRIRALPPAGSLAEVDALAGSLKPYAVDTPWRVLSKEYIDHCHAAGIQVFADAPGYVDVKGYRRAIEWGIDVVQTDFPLRLWRAMELVDAERAGK